RAAPLARTTPRGDAGLGVLRVRSVVRMTTRRWRLRLAALVAVTAWVSAPRAGADVVPPPSGGPAPNFALTTQQDDRLWLAQLRGRLVVLAFGCTRCGGCPGLVGGLSQGARGLRDPPVRRALF